MSLGQRRVCVPTASGWSCVSREIYKVEHRKIPRYSRVSYHQKGTRTRMWSGKCADCRPDPFRLQSTTYIYPSLAACFRVNDRDLDVYDLVVRACQEAVDVAYRNGVEHVEQWVETLLETPPPPALID